MLWFLLQKLRNVVKRPNTGSTVWADTAYGSKKNEAWLDKNGFVSDIHQKKPKGRPMSEATARANGRRSKIRSHIEHVFAHQKAGMGLFVRTIGIARATMKSAWQTSPTTSSDTSGRRKERRPHDAAQG